MPPKVSVCLITYNHENYIRPCLDNILSQQVDFDFEIVIGEDKSTDKTPEIIREYQQKHPELIRIIDSTNNVGMVANWEKTLVACKGNYIAIIEGDDCWISNSKLQKQADMLDHNYGYAMCFHDVETEFGAGVKAERTLGVVDASEALSIKDIILRNWFIPTCGLMIKKEFLPPFPSWTAKLQSIDLVVELMVAMHGGVGYINERMGLYRIHAAGISQVQWRGKENKLQLSVIDIFKKFDKYSEGRFRLYVQQRLARAYQAIMRSNSPWSAVYLKAMASMIAMNPKQNLPMIKDWLILHAVPQPLYKIYRKLK